jgi:hypothetical protein
MKNFDRFAHEGVKADLLRVKNELSLSDKYNYGSSGEGEITIQGKSFTAYARKYKAKDGWRLVVCAGGREAITFPQNLETVVKTIKAANK